MINYKKLLEKNGVYDVDYVTENGYFRRKYKTLDKNVKVGYEGYIKYDEDGTHILYIKRECLNYESYLEDTQLFNTQYYKTLIAVNYDNNNFEINLANIESSDIEELYLLYVCDPTSFIKRQELLTKLEDINYHINDLKFKRGKILENLNLVDTTLRRDIDLNGKSIIKRRQR